MFFVYSLLITEIFSFLDDFSRAFPVSMDLLTFLLRFLAGSKVLLLGLGLIFGRGDFRDLFFFRSLFKSLFVAVFR